MMISTLKLIFLIHARSLSQSESLLARRVAPNSPEKGTVGTVGWVEHLRNPSASGAFSDGFRCAQPILQISPAKAKQERESFHALSHLDA